MLQTNHSTHQNRLLGAMSLADTDQFFSDLHSVDLALQQVPYEVGEVIADLTALPSHVPPDSSRAAKLAEIIRGLQGRDDNGARLLRW